MMRRRAFASTVAALAAVAVASCGQQPRAADTVVYASGADLESANPLVTVHSLSRQLQRYALFVTLARYDDSLTAEPYAARSWDWSADRRSLTFRMTPALQWHDGTPTTSRDVAFTIEAARDPVTGFPRHADLAGIARVDTPDDSTVVLHFLQPPAQFPSVLCELPIVPAHLLSGVPRRAMRDAPFNRAPVGNGPFRFRERSVGQRWVFERNERFPSELGGAPRIRRLVVAVVDEATTKFAGLVGGELDVAGISPSMAFLAARDPNLRVLDYPVLVSYGIVFNTHRAPFDDARVRRALALAIDRRRVVDAALAGYASPAYGPIPVDHPYAVDEASLQDAVAAQRLLDEAGWRRSGDGVRRRNGRELTFSLLTVGSSDNAAEQLLQADFAAIGVGMEIAQREMGTFLSEARAREKRFDALFTGVPGDLSLAYLSAMFDTRLAGGALDYGGFHEATLDRLLEAARSSPNDAESRQRWSAVQRYLREQMPVAWVYHARGVQGLSRRLRNVTMDLRGEMVSLSRWHVEPNGASVANAR